MYFVRTTRQGTLLADTVPPGTRHCGCDNTFGRISVTVCNAKYY